MIALDAADLVVIAGRTLGIGTDAALEQMDIAAAQDALAEARPPGLELAGRAGAATAGVGLVRALLRHRPFPVHAQQVAVAAGLQFLSLNGWRADLNPPSTAAVVVEALASGRLTPGDAAAWLAPRLSRARRAGQAHRAGRAPGTAARSGRGLPGSLPAARVPVGRAVAGVLLAVAVTGVTLLSAACSRGPDVPAAPSGGVSVVQPSAGSAPAGSAPTAADTDYAACMRSHGVAGLSYPSASDVAAIAPAGGIGLSSLPFSAIEVACRR
ncbi:MAG TPA: hypothetical protein VHT26_22905 [Trebonia sp.]|nr:hypothetical protein [Trebonia sp.]